MGLKVFKIGGAIVNDNAKLQAFIDSFSRVEGPKVLVHGGGVRATELAGKLGIPTQMVEGRRITDTATLEIVSMVYAGLNKRIVAALQNKGVAALGLSGADLNLVPAQRRQHPEIDFGYVGDVCEEKLSPTMLKRLLALPATPVFCALTAAEGSLLNTNADTIASALARSLAKVENVELVYCFELRGVMGDPSDSESLIPRIDPDAFRQLVKSGVIRDGMIPKLDNAFDAIAAGVRSVRITHFAELEGGTCVVG